MWISTSTRHTPSWRGTYFSTGATLPLYLTRLKSLYSVQVSLHCVCIHFLLKWGPRIFSLFRFPLHWDKLYIFWRRNDTVWNVYDSLITLQVFQKNHLLYPYNKHYMVKLQIFLITVINGYHMLIHSPRLSTHAFKKCYIRTLYDCYQYTFNHHFQPCNH